MSASYEERRAKGKLLIAEHKAKLAEEYGVVGHPKLNALYQLAWDHGHSSGFAEVEIYFGQFVELIK